MIEAIVLGLVQGIFEWLPISSEGAMVAVKSTFFAEGETLTDLIHLSLFLHLGTFLAALVYFREDVMDLIKSLARIRLDRDSENTRIIYFLFTSTLVSGVLGIGLLALVDRFEQNLVAGSAIINVVVALMLFITAYLQMQPKNDGMRTAKELKIIDSLLLGVAQGFAVMPGLSRSGLTVSVLLLRKFDDALSLKLSFLMSLPIVLLGNIFLNHEMFRAGITFNMTIALVASFLAGILTIDILLRVAKKVNFAYFTAGFGILLLISILF
jgi:undecaprenyl-diphosphatase